MRVGLTARPRVIRGTRTALLPLLPSGPGGVRSRPLHGARDLTSIYRSMHDSHSWRKSTAPLRRGPTYSSAAVRAMVNSGFPNSLLEILEFRDASRGRLRDRAYRLPVETLFDSAR